MSITNTINVNKVIDNQTIAANGSYTSYAIDLNNLKPNGYYSLQVAVTGSGACKFEYLASNDGFLFAEPAGATDIGSGITATTIIIASFTPIPCAYLKIKCTETGGANTVTVNAWLCII
jgi:hypothetical protein